MPADALPPLHPRVLALYVQARIDAMLQRLVPRYWSGQEVTPMELYGMLGAIAELKGLVVDAERSQRERDTGESLTPLDRGPGQALNRGSGQAVSGPEYGRRTHRG